MKSLLLALILVSSPLAAQAQLPSHLEPSCTAISNRRACWFDDCACEVVSEVTGGSKLMGRAAILRAQNKDQSLVTFNLLIETDGQWVDFGAVHEALRGEDGSEASGRIERFDVVETTGGVRVLRVDFSSTVKMTNEEQNVRSTLTRGGMILAFPRGDELYVVQLFRVVETDVERLDKKGKRPPVKMYGPEGSFRWVREVELLEDGRVRVSKRSGTHPLAKKKDPFAGDHALERLHTFEAKELEVRTPEI